MGNGLRQTTLDRQSGKPGPGCLDFLKKQSGEQADGTTTKAVGEQDEGLHRKKPNLLCRACSNPITSRDERVELAGAHNHTFANPGGHIFIIGCFRAAGGCISASAETMDFTWFESYAWSMVACRVCMEHLGWRYRSEKDMFYGLILDKLIEQEELRH